MQLGFSREELLVAFAIALISSRQDIQIMKERGLRTELGEFPSDKQIYDEVTALFESLEPGELITVVFMALLKVIKSNNERIATDLDSYLQNLPPYRQFPRKYHWPYKRLYFILRQHLGSFHNI